MYRMFMLTLMFFSLSGSCSLNHFPLSSPNITLQMWPKLIAKAKEGGLDVIQTYVFWNVHEPVQGQVDALSSFM